jgi:hypothetical protein
VSQLVLSGPRREGDDDHVCFACGEEELQELDAVVCEKAEAFAGLQQRA